MSHKHVHPIIRQHSHPIHPATTLESDDIIPPKNMILKQAAKKRMDWLINPTNIETWPWKIETIGFLRGSNYSNFFGDCFSHPTCTKAQCPKHTKKWKTHLFMVRPIQHQHASVTRTFKKPGDCFDLCLSLCAHEAPGKRRSALPGLIADMAGF